MWIYLDGKLVKDATAKISIDNLAYQFGLGAFTTILAKNNKIYFFDDHYHRLQTTCKQLGLTFTLSKTQCLQVLWQLMKKNKLPESQLKIMVSSQIAILIKPHQPLPQKIYEKGATLFYDPQWQHPQSFLSMHKTTSYAVYYLAKQAALKNKALDCILTNNNHEILECATANIFIIKGNKIITPPVASGILPGIIRNRIFKVCKKGKIPIHEKKLTWHLLQNADTVFVSNSLKGIVPITKIMGEKTFVFKTHPLTQCLNVELGFALLG